MKIKSFIALFFQTLHSHKTTLYSFLTILVTSILTVSVMNISSKKSNKHEETFANTVIVQSESNGVAGTLEATTRIKISKAEITTEDSSTVSTETTTAKTTALSTAALITSAATTTTATPTTTQAPTTTTVIPTTTHAPTTAATPTTSASSTTITTTTQSIPVVNVQFPTLPIVQTNTFSSGEIKFSFRVDEASFSQEYLSDAGLVRCKFTFSCTLLDKIEDRKDFGFIFLIYDENNEHIGGGDGMYVDEDNSIGFGDTYIVSDSEDILPGNYKLEIHEY